LSILLSTSCLWIDNIQILFTRDRLKGVNFALSFALLGGQF
jgi:hypothetical protein